MSTSIQPSRRKASRAAVVIVVVAIAAAAAWLWHARSVAADAGGYRTVAVTRGDIRVTISATGTLSAISTVDVGSQISGQVIDVLADFNDHVRKDQVLAHIDPSTYEAQIAKGPLRSPVRAQILPARRPRCAMPASTTRARPRSRSSSWWPVAMPTLHASRATRP